ncbi:hypothetical protein OG339_48500 (plasmid) [Streptosporangium sp. NBC_01495]|uniref:hypothetical protein n=1 Tax=Streptosporangium sp. NBC_01495 TaxID=2903899 RepID=UPI002E360704|nr:hypothetical protein [Streptosporangium sp. NBC_01495]
MPSASDLDRLAQQRLRALIGAGVIIVILVLVVVALWPGSDTPPQSAPSPTQSPTASSLSPGQGEYVVAERSTRLPDPGRYLNRTYRVQFPHTVEGAAAAAVAMYQQVWTLDPGAAGKAVDVYFTAADRPARRADAAASSTWMRQQMGLPATGEVPAGANVSIQATGVQWKIVDADNVYVSVLMRLDMMAGPGATLQTTSAATTVHMRWDPTLRGGDWAVIQTPANQMPKPATAEVGTVAYNEQGWMAIRPGG